MISPCRAPFFTRSVFALLSAVLLFSSPEAKAERKFMTFGTAGVTGVYYPVAGTICRLVNRHTLRRGIYGRFNR